jgi:hypothetical protein
MKFADDEHLTPVGIWLKHKIITTWKLVEVIFEKQNQGAAPPRQITHEGTGGERGENLGKDQWRRI